MACPSPEAESAVMVTIMLLPAGLSLGTSMVQPVILLILSMMPPSRIRLATERTCSIYTYALPSRYTAP